MIKVDLANRNKYYNRLIKTEMFTSLSTSKVFTAAATRSFRTSAVAAATNKSMAKPSIGDAVTILQSKVSGINQVVSKLFLCAIELFHSSELRILQ